MINEPIEKSPSTIIEEEIEEIEEEAAQASIAGSIAADIKVLEERVWQLYRDNLKQKQELHMKDLFKNRLHYPSDEPIENRWETQEYEIDSTHQHLFDCAILAAKNYHNGWSLKEFELLEEIDQKRSELEKLNNQNQPI